MNSIMKPRKEKKLSISQRQAVIKLIEKKERDKRFIKNWCPISLLSVDCKAIPKALATRLQAILPKLMSFQQTEYVKNKLIIIVDIEKAVDSLSHFLKNMDMEMTL